VKGYDGAIFLTLAAVSLALAAAIYLALGPTYRGESVTAVALGGTASEPVRTTATLIEINGLRVLPLILTPVLLTALSALAATLIPADLVWRGPLVLASAVCLLGFCLVGLYSIGLFFLPAAFALIAAGVMGSTRRRQSFRPS
jgi:hypothetical protein